MISFYVSFFDDGTIAAVNWVSYLYPASKLRVEKPFKTTSML
jgi:hypothetical protein